MEGKKKKTCFPSFPVSMYGQTVYSRFPHFTTMSRALWWSGQKDLTLVAGISIILLLCHACPQQKKAKPNRLFLSTTALSALGSGLQQHWPDQGHCWPSDKPVILQPQGQYTPAFPYFYKKRIFLSAEEKKKKKEFHYCSSWANTGRTLRFL